ncbi:hypothetical protein [Ferruginivarius sediminum]|uniref:hypothetical protein n=1 Tax=Ferruginivarius sediminum TaxID=2661937 RepID=UPI0011C04169|nr:hypothetical protein [Ferruginivarius sediminum]
MHPVFLHRAAGDLRDAEIAEERDQVQAQPRLVALDPPQAALAFSDNLVLALEGGGRLFEGRLADQFALAVPVAQGQIPVLGEFLRELEAFLLGAGAAVAPGEIGRDTSMCRLRVCPACAHNAKRA